MKRFAGLLLLISVFALIFAVACGGDDDEEEATRVPAAQPTAAPAPTATTPPAEPTEFRMAVTADPAFIDPHRILLVQTTDLPLRHPRRPFGHCISVAHPPPHLLSTLTRRFPDFVCEPDGIASHLVQIVLVGPTTNVSEPALRVSLW